MFTGIVTDVGRVRSVQETNRDLRFEIETAFDTATIDIGASVSHAGCCLTVVDKGPGWFAVEVSGETLSMTTLSDWAEGRPVNLERAARVGDELGGHIVSGHVDGVAEVVGVRPEGDSLRVTFRAPEALAKFIAPKGSVALNGTSLTVNEVEGRDFGINFIPHTQKVTTWGEAALGDKINLEVDTMARYVARLRDWG
jgi:riboflavin synthase